MGLAFIFQCASSRVVGHRTTQQPTPVLRDSHPLHDRRHSDFDVFKDINDLDNWSLVCNVNGRALGRAVAVVDGYGFLSSEQCILLRPLPTHNVSKYPRQSQKILFWFSYTMTNCIVSSSRTRLNVLNPNILSRMSSARSMMTFNISG